MQTKPNQTKLNQFNQSTQKKYFDFFCSFSYYKRREKKEKIVKEKKVLQRKNTQKICTSNKKGKIKIKAVVKNKVINL